MEQATIARYVEFHRYIQDGTESAHIATAITESGEKILEWANPNIVEQKPYSDATLAAWIAEWDESV